MLERDHMKVGIFIYLFFVNCLFDQSIYSFLKSNNIDRKYVNEILLLEINIIELNLR